MSKRIRLERVKHSGSFWAKSGHYPQDLSQPYSNSYSRSVVPRLCCAATTRIFGLTRGGKYCTVVFTKRKPAGKSYELHKCKKSWSSYKTLNLRGYNGGLHLGVRYQLQKAYDDGYRYVRVV